VLLPEITMPELPEVETIARGLRRTIVGKRIEEVKANFPGIVRQNFRSFRRSVIGKEIQGVRRRGKCLLIDLSGGRTILVHLGMTGNLLFAKGVGSPPQTPARRGSQAAPYDKHDHLIFRFSDANKELRYNDLRKFGKLKAFNTAEEKAVPELAKLGPESLEIIPSEFARIFGRRKARVKSALLNQQIVAGLGNIYADESLFEARIHPERRADSLSERKLKDLHTAIRKTLQKAIRAGGSSIDNYVHVDGQIGGFQLQHQVYGREGERCGVCGAKIKRIKISQRSSYFCPKCQALKDA
jgi:formamidopyrimidine-DNA glycosylase